MFLHPFLATRFLDLQYLDLHLFLDQFTLAQ